MPGDLRLISPTWPWLPPAATGQLAPVSSFSHLVTLREDADPYSFLPPAAWSCCPRSRRKIYKSLRRLGLWGVGKEPHRDSRHRTTFAPFALWKSCPDSATGASNDTGEAGKLKLCTEGRRYGQGAGRETIVPGYSRRIPTPV